MLLLLWLFVVILGVFGVILHHFASFLWWFCVFLEVLWWFCVLLWWFCVFFVVIFWTLCGSTLSGLKLYLPERRLLWSFPPDWNTSDFVESVLTADDVEASGLKCVCVFVCLQLVWTSTFKKQLIRRARTFCYLSGLFGSSDPLNSGRLCGAPRSRLPHKSEFLQKDSL